VRLQNKIIKKPFKHLRKCFIQINIFAENMPN